MQVDAFEKPKGEGMTPVLKLLENRLMMIAVGTAGDSCSCVGVYTAVTNKKVLGMPSQTWFMLAFVNYLYFIMSLLSRLIDKMESLKAE
jgi:uncharacterized membrane protein